MKKAHSYLLKTKKSYRKPVLNKFGNVTKLTKGKQGSLYDDDTTELTYSPD
ncbi:hypothetical protein [Dyadobacter bucti]|uniref:hypothetical protein n=1 Tax=Dyadobacter bucti TaxID=2572203 RepID=UPI003F7253EF